MCRSVPQADALAQVPGPSWIENVIIGDYPPRFYRLQHTAMNRSTRLIIALIFFLTPGALQADNRNVILIIGDGFDDQHVTMGRNYLAGMSGKLGVDRLPFRASVQVETLSASGDPPLRGRLGQYRHLTGYRRHHPYWQDRHRH